MENQLINIDSRFRDKSIYKESSSFKINIEKIKFVKYIKLSSIEIPNTFYIFTKKKDNISFIITINKTDHPIIIEEGSYTIDLLFNYIQILFNNLNNSHGYNLMLTFNEISSCCNISNGSEKLNINFTNTTKYPSLGYMLGFRKNIYTCNNNYTSESVVNIVGDDYIFLRINDYGIIYNDNLTYKLLAKIIINKNKGTTIFDNQANFLSKEYIFKKPVNISTLKIELYDSYGNLLCMDGQDFSATLEVGKIYEINEKYSSLFNDINMFNDIASVYNRS